MTNDDRVSCSNRTCENCAWDYTFGEDSVCLQEVSYTFPDGKVCLEINGADEFEVWCESWNHRSNPHREAAIMAFQNSPLRAVLLEKFQRAAE